MSKNLACFIFSLLISISASTYALTTQDEIKNNMNAMTSLWNKGDVKAFVNYYKNSETTTYVSASVYKGYQAISARYLAAYPTSENMGTLTASHLDIHALSPTIATVVGEWSLAKKASAPLHGIFTLVWEKTADGWKIVLDHTS